jgi:hypothetical protein
MWLFYFTFSFTYLYMCTHLKIALYWDVIYNLNEVVLTFVLYLVKAIMNDTIFGRLLLT